MQVDVNSFDWMEKTLEEKKRKSRRSVDAPKNELLATRVVTG